MARKSIEMVAWLVSQHSGDPSVTVGELAKLYDQTPERITDAIDVLKIRRGEVTQIPPVPWFTEG